MRPFLGRVVVLAASMVAVMFVASALYAPPLSKLEIIGARPHPKYAGLLQVDVRAAIGEGGRATSFGVNPHLSTERLGPTGWELASVLLCGAGLRDVTLPGGSEYAWTEVVSAEEHGLRRFRFYLERSTWFGLRTSYERIVSEPFRLAELLATSSPSRDVAPEVATEELDDANRRVSAAGPK